MFDILRVVLVIRKGLQTPIIRVACAFCNF